jgi:putative endonuclease
MTAGHYTYILASKRSGALYIGVTDNLVDCVLDHKCNLVPGITSQYAINQLVYYEYYQDVESAERRELAIRQMHRIWKLDLIERHNPNWRDLYQDIASPNGMPQPNCHPAA